MIFNHCRSDYSIRLFKDSLLKLLHTYESKYFDKKGMQVEIIKLHGSVELAPILGIAEEILDITATGETLKENNLVEMESIMVSTTRLIANIVSYRTKHELVDDFVNKIRKVIK